MKAERESVSVHDRHGQSPGWHGDRPPSQQFALEGLIICPEQSGGQYYLRAFPRKSGAATSPDQREGERPNDGMGLKEPGGRGSAT